MRIFLESNQPVTCLRTSQGYTIHDYHLRDDVLLLLEQAFHEDLEVRLWEGTKVGKGERVRIIAYNYLITKKRKDFRLAFNVVHLDRKPRWYPRNVFVP